MVKIKPVFSGCEPGVSLPAVCICSGGTFAELLLRWDFISHTVTLLRILQGDYFTRKQIFKTYSSVLSWVLPCPPGSARRTHTVHWFLHPLQRCSSQVFIDGV